MRRSRRDLNQSEIASALQKCGASVVSLSDRGDGVPDLLVGVAGKNYLLEVKNENLPPSKRKLTKDEARFHETWQGQVSIVENIADALRVCGLQ